VDYSSLIYLLPLVQDMPMRIYSVALCRKLLAQGFCGGYLRFLFLLF
jgi:hypothetical protein